MSEAAARQCPVCNHLRTGGVACHFCGQVDGLPLGVTLSSPLRRLAAYLAEALLIVVTLFVGWLLWALVAFRRGETPGKQLLGMKAVKLEAGRRAGWGTMFLRELVAKPVIGFLAVFTFGLLYCWLLWDERNQELWDKAVGTIVVDDPHGQLS